RRRIGKPPSVSPTISCVTPGGRGAPGLRRAASPRSTRPRTKAADVSSDGTITSFSLAGPFVEEPPDVGFAFISRRPGTCHGADGGPIIPGTFYRLIMHQSTVEQTPLQSNGSVVCHQPMAANSCSVVETCVLATDSSLVHAPPAKQVIDKSDRGG